MFTRGYSSLGARARGGTVRRRRSMSHMVRPCQESGFDGSHQGTSGSCIVRMGPYMRRTPIRDSRVIHQGPSGHIGFRWVSFEPCFGTTGPDGARRIARLSHIGARLMYGPIRDPLASPRSARNCSRDSLSVHGASDPTLEDCSFSFRQPRQEFR